MITDADVTKLKKTLTTKDALIDFKDSILHEIRAIRNDIAIWKNTLRARSSGQGRMITALCAASPSKI
jgi:hypothetical protein